MHINIYKHINIYLYIVNTIYIYKYIKEGVKWAAHQSSVRRKLSNMTSVVARFVRSPNIKARKNIVQAFVLPHQTYCLPV